MFSKGQSALDLLLALLVLLIVLNVFSTVLTRFEEVQKEISIRQQLRENLSLMGLFVQYGSAPYYGIYIIPPTNSLTESTFLTDYSNRYLRTRGWVELEQVHATNTQTNLACSLFYDINGFINFGAYAYPADTGLPYTIDTNYSAAIKTGYDINHTFISSGCFDYFSIEALP